MAFKVKQGQVKTMYLPVTPSTAIAVNTLVAWSSGKLIAATSSSTPQATVGVLLKAIASTDTDYALDRVVPVQVPVELNVVWDADFTATFVATDLGVPCDLTNGGTVNRGANSIKIVTPVVYQSATKGQVIFNIGPMART